MREKGKKIAVALTAVECALVCTLLFLPGVCVPFLFDDETDIVERIELRKGPIAAAASSPYRAVTYFTYGVDWRSGGGRAGNFHLTSILLHATIVVMVFGVSWNFSKRSFGARLAGATFAALFFGLNPLMVSNVTYISGRAGMLAAFFCIPVLWLYHLRPFRLWILPALFFFILALFSKEDAASLPLLLLLMGSKSDENKKGWIWSVPFFAVALVYGILRVLWHKVELGGEADFLPHLLLTPYAWMKALFISIFPIGLSIDHYTPKIQSALDVRLLSIPLLIIAAFSGYFLWRRNRSSTWPIAWFLIALLPSGIIPLADAVMENRLYFALAGLSIGMGEIFAGIFGSGLKRALASAFSVLLALSLLGILTVHRQVEWRSKVRVWGNASRMAPTSERPLNHIALARFNAGDLRGAETIVRRNLKISPSDYIAWNTLGLILKDKGQYEQAIEAYDKAIALDPKIPKARTNRASVLLYLGKVKEAEAGYLEALSRDDTDADAHYGLGFIYMIAGKTEQAKAEMKKVMELNPEDAMAKEMLRQLEANRY